jgi:hypothetical protein
MRPTLKILTAVPILFFCTALWADTGTYQILDYQVKLTPNPNGSVEIAYYQKWLVTGGGIPWITVGMPNSDFKIVPNSNKGNATRVYPENTGNWSGVRVNLDRNYSPSKTFEVGFTITQNMLFYDDGKDYRLVFWPGWYDRAKTDSLRVEVYNSAKLDLVKVSPKPDSIENQSLIWERKNLGLGEKFKIFFSVPKTSMTGKITTGEKYVPIKMVTVLAIISLSIGAGFLIFIVFCALRYRLKYSYGSGPRVYYGGTRGTSTLMDHASSAYVCACACAGCACACACAGGSAAGCERKLSQWCALCRQCKKKHLCAVWNKVA